MGIDQSPTVTHKNDREFLQADVHRNLFKCTTSEERGDRVDYRDEPLHRQACGESDNVLLGNALHEKTLRPQFLKIGHRSGTQVGADEYNPRVVQSHFDNFVRTSFSHRVLPETRS
ncbi:hypothetical protein D3C87_1080350 [compost metagenome]